MRSDLLAQIRGVEEIAALSKINRLRRNPMKYIWAIGFRQFVYPFYKKGWFTGAKLFFGAKMKIVLPAATDLYLTGGKSHRSEIRLSKFMIINLRAEEHFLDIGAHFGFFTLLAAEIVGDKGKVKAFEPSTKNYPLLLANTQAYKQVEAIPKAISNTSEHLVFYEFPPLYSEYSSADIEQFRSEAWFEKNRPTKTEVPATTIDALTGQGHFLPNMIKIDAEGGELMVIEGGRQFFLQHSPVIVMEYLAPERKNEAHQKAKELLVSLGYFPHIILDDGQISSIGDIDAYLEQEQQESDNIVFLKPNS